MELDARGVRLHREAMEATPQRSRIPKPQKRRRASRRKRIYRSSSSSAHHYPILIIHPHQQRQSNAVHHNAGAAIAEQRQCEALGRQQTEIDPHIDERLYANPQSDALGGQRGKDAIQRERLPANRKARRTSHANSSITPETPTNPSSSPITARMKSVCASGR